MASRVLCREKTREMEGVLLCSRVKNDVAHITQVCVAPKWQGRGLGGQMIENCLAYLHQQGVQAVTLTVTQQNTGAARLYDRLGFLRRHTFDAMLWVSPPMELARLPGHEGKG